MHTALVPTSRTHPLPRRTPAARSAPRQEISVGVTTRRRRRRIHRRRRRHRRRCRRRRRRRAWSTAFSRRFRSAPRDLPRARPATILVTSHRRLPAGPGRNAARLPPVEALIAALGHGRPACAPPSRICTRQPPRPPPPPQQQQKLAHARVCAPAALACGRSGRRGNGQNDGATSESRPESGPLGT